MFTEKSPRFWTAVPVALPSPIQNSSMQGESDTDVSELTVAPNNSPFHSVPTTATPVANAPIKERKRLGSIAEDVEICLFMSPRSSSRHSLQPHGNGAAVAAPFRGGMLFPHHVVAEFAGVGQIRYLPTVEVVFRHAVLGKTFEAIGVAGSLCSKQAIPADFLGRTAIVDFIEFVPSAELAADAIPKQLEELDALLGLVTVGSAQIAI